jgi:hypothetical protein
MVVPKSIMPLKNGSFSGITFEVRILFRKKYDKNYSDASNVKTLRDNQIAGNP